MRIFNKNKWNTPNGIWVKDTVLSMIESGKTKEEVIDFFFDNNGYFLWGANTKESITNTVDEIMSMDRNENVSKFCHIISTLSNSLLGMGFIIITANVVGFLLLAFLVKLLN